jgi:hypothetical protein
VRQRCARRRCARRRCAVGSERRAMCGDDVRRRCVVGSERRAASDVRGQRGRGRCVSRDRWTMRGCAAAAADCRSLPRLVIVATFEIVFGLAPFRPILNLSEGRNDHRPHRPGSERLRAQPAVLSEGTRAARHRAGDGSGGLGRPGPRRSLPAAKTMDHPVSGKSITPTTTQLSLLVLMGTTSKRCHTRRGNSVATTSF